jgi:transposase
MNLLGFCIFASKKRMEILQQISELLPISAPFFIERMEKDDSEQVVHIYLSVSKQARPSSDYHIHSHYSRTWEHLRLFQYRTFIHCDLPVYRHKNKPKDLQKAVVSFARDHARFTLLYEQEVLRLMRLHHCMSTVAQQLGVLPQRIAQIYHDYTQESYLQHTITPCEKVGCDETNTHKGHDYITLFVDIDKHQILDIQDVKSSEALAFVADFAQESMGENPFTKTIYRHFEGIAQYSKTQLTHGLLEGINSKIQTIKRIARGFRYKEHFKKMILFVFGTIKTQIPCKIT